MLPKNFAFLGILLFFLTLVLITKSSEESLKEAFSSLPILTVEQRSAVIEKSLSGYQERVSEKLKQDIVNVTESYDRSKICDLMFGIMRSRPAASSFEETCRKVLTRDERSGVIKNILSLHNKSTTNFSIKSIIDQTEGYTTLQLSTFVFDAMKNPAFEQEINSRKLVYEKATNYKKSASSLPNDKRHISSRQGNFC